MTAQEKKEFAQDCIKALTQMVKENQTHNPEFYYSTMQHCEATAKDYETVNIICCLVNLQILNLNKHEQVKVNVPNAIRYLGKEI